MREQLLKISLGATVALVSPMIHAAAWAQAVPGGEVAATDDRASGLGEIVVTAQRRAENAQDVPIAVTAISAESLAAQGITDPQQLARAVPGLNYDRSSQGATPFIRGVGVNSSVMGNEPSVATFIDDVYVPYNVAGFDFNAIRSIEVSRGPQGTLFGRNATGGVIQIHTEDPSDEVHVRAGASYGSFERVAANFYVSTPIASNISANLAATGSRQEGGWGRNFFLGRDGFTEKTYGIRAKLRFAPGPDTTIILGYNRDYRESDIGIGTRAVKGAAGFNNFVAEATYPTIGFYDQVTNVDGFYENKSDRYSLKAEHDFGGAVVTSVTAYGDVKPYILSDVDASPTNRFQIDSPARDKTFTQELRVASDSGGPLQWVAGVFYMHDKAIYDAHYFGTAFQALGGSGISDVYATQVTKSYSGFVDGTYEIAPGTKVTAGVRYTSDRREFDGYADWNFTNGTRTRSGPFSDATTFDKLTYRLSVFQKVSEDIGVYAGLSRGFKSGVYNLAAISPSPVAVTTFAPPVRPEVLDSYTVGFKSELLDRTVRFNVEGFWYDYKDIQVTTLQTGGTLLLNGARARVKGVEAEVLVAPMEGLTLSGSATYMKARFRDFPNGPTFFPVGPASTPIPIPPGCSFTAYPVQAGGNPLQQRACNLAGNRMGHAPDFQANAALNYNFPIGDGTGGFNLAYAHTSSYFFEPDNLYLTRQPPTDLVSASLSYKTADGFEVGVRGRNLTKEEYYSYIVESTTSGVKYSPAAPRELEVYVAMGF